MTEQARFFGEEESELLLELVNDALRQNEEAYEQIVVDRSIIDIGDFSASTQGQRETIALLQRVKEELSK